MRKLYHCLVLYIELNTKICTLQWLRVLILHCNFWIINWKCETMSVYTKQERRGKFISNIFAECEKLIPKRNSVMVVSRPSAGKNVGIIQNFNRYNNFPLMEAINRRLNYWNIPNVEVLFHLRVDEKSEANWGRFRQKPEPVADRGQGLLEFFQQSGGEEGTHAGRGPEYDQPGGHQARGQGD